MKNINETVLREVDDEIYLLQKRIQFKHNLTWAKSRDLVNFSIQKLYSFKNCDKCNKVLTKENSNTLNINENGILEGYCNKCIKK